MTFYELMFQSLSDLLEKGETLESPIYGTLCQGRAYDFAYFGLTETTLLIAQLQGDSKVVRENGRVPLSSIQQVKVKKSLIPMMYILHINLDGGKTIKIKAAKKYMALTRRKKI